MDAYKQLEQKFANFIGAEPDQVVACSSGTAALHLALEALYHNRPTHNVRAILPDFTMISCARAVTLAGLQPVFVDCFDDLTIDHRCVRDAYTMRTGVLMPVHIYGRRCSMSILSQFAKEQGLLVVEDMAELHGTPPHYSTDAACWSFYKNKIIHGEEGGAVYFRHPNHAKVARQLRCVGFTEDHDFRHIPRGHNYRLANLLAKPIIKSLDDYYTNIAHRWKISLEYVHNLPSDIQMPPADSPWVFVLKVKSEHLRNRLVTALNKRGVQARRAFVPLSEQLEYISHSRTRRANRNALRASQRVLYLPVDITHWEAELAISVTRDVLN